MISRALVLTLLMAAVPASAYYSVLDTGEILPSGLYKLTGNMQVLTENSKLNLGVRGDMGISDEFGLRVIGGFGEMDTFLGAMFKWMPIPDVDKQPAMGFGIGLIYGNDDDMTDVTIRFEPLISKTFEYQGTVFTPYGAVPLGLRMRDHDNDSLDSDKATLQMVGGVQVQVEKWKSLQFIGEIGVDLTEAPGFLNFGVVYYFGDVADPTPRNRLKSTVPVQPNRMEPIPEEDAY